MFRKLIAIFYLLCFNSSHFTLFLNHQNGMSSKKMCTFDTSFSLHLIEALLLQKLVKYGENAMAERTARYWFAKFKEENFDLKDAPRSGRPTELDEGQLNQLLHEDSRQTTRELAERINCSHTCIEKHLHLMGKVQKCGVWVKAWLDEFLLVTL